jgi:fermentation-respiration switch protein FrsA (DUF1100 family)
VTRNVRDLVAAATLMVQRGFGPCALVGHSLGGAAVLLAAASVHTVGAVVVIGAPASPGHVRGLLVGAEDEIRREGRALVEIAGRQFPISAEFLDDLGRHDQRQHVTDLGRPLLVVHAVDDEVVPVQEGEAIFAAARQPKAFVPLLDSDHLVTDPAAAETLLRVVTDWLDRTP